MARTEEAHMVNPIPDDYPRVTPYLYVDDAAAAITFYCEVLGGTERMRLPSPGGRVGHAEIQFGPAVVMLADEHPEMGTAGPRTVGGTASSLLLYVDDVDATVAAAERAGARIVQPIEDKFYGDRSGQIEDPFGHVWSLASRVEDVPPDEMARRAAAFAED
jgi:PhnB protein